MSIELLLSLLNNRAQSDAARARGLLTTVKIYQGELYLARTPWCAVAVHPSIMMHPSAMEWLGDFERCCAWAWITRNPTLETADA